VLNAMKSKKSKQNYKHEKTNKNTCKFAGVFLCEKILAQRIVFFVKCLYRKKERIIMNTLKGAVFYTHTHTHTDSFVACINCVNCIHANMKTDK
jgi:hypothetical protein